MLSMETLTYGVLALLGVISLIGTYLAIIEKDLVRAVIFSALQSTAYAFIFYILMAPDIVLVYVPVAVGLYPAIILFLIKKTGRLDGDES